MRRPRDEGPQDEIVNSFGMRLKLIKPGTFLMGSPKGEGDAVMKTNIRNTSLRSRGRFTWAFTR